MDPVVTFGISGASATAARCLLLILLAPVPRTVLVTVVDDGHRPDLALVPRLVSRYDDALGDGLVELANDVGRLIDPEVVDEELPVGPDILGH